MEFTKEQRFTPEQRDNAIEYLKSIDFKHYSIHEFPDGTSMFYIDSSELGPCGFNAQEFLNAINGK